MDDFMLEFEVGAAVVAWFAQLIVVAYSYGRLSEKVNNLEQDIAEIKVILRARGYPHNREHQ